MVFGQSDIGGSFDFPAASGSSDKMERFGALAFLSSFCPLHRNWTASRLQAVFGPPVALKFVRLFNNSAGTPCAALIWARLSDEVAAALLRGERPIRPDEWNSGDTLWFVDLLAPFGHGKQVCRALARTPPVEPFHFARVGVDGIVRKVVRGDATASRPKRLRVLDPNALMAA